MPEFYTWAKPILWRLDPESAHRLSVLALKTFPYKWFGPSAPDRVLEQSLWGLNFSSPVGLAAGYDKDAEVIKPLFSLGFGFVEVGGITLRPQQGNTAPRLFRLTEDEAIINRMGLNSVGVDTVVKRLEKRSIRTLSGPLIINLGLNKDSQSPASEYAELAARLAPFADILTLNVSSPNTPGLRSLQETHKLKVIVEAVRVVISKLGVPNKPSLLIKIGPDLPDKDLSELATFAVSERIDGLVVSNTTVSRPDSLLSRYRNQTGGLSGRPLFEASTRMLRIAYERTAGTIPLIGVGGISSGLEAYAKVRAGASLVQLYSALVFKGPGLVARISQDLSKLLKQNGYDSIVDAVGADHREGESP